MADPILLPEPPVRSVADHVARGGGRGLARARAVGPDRTVEEVAASGLRGRGGAGFPTGRKWRSVRGDGPGDAAGDRYVVCNGAEGEPGTFKDRAILRADPYQVVEGVAVAALAVGASEAFIAVKASFEPEIEALSRALVELAEADLVGDAPITLVSGPDEYLFGEETGLLQVVEGDAPLPRLFPPYLQGLYATTPNSGWSARAGLSSPDGPPTSFGAANPTLVNNVETLATAGHVLARGSEWHRSLGTKQSAGVTVCTVTGDVARAGVAEIEMGTPLRAVLDRIGAGPADPDRAFKAVLSGVANPVILPQHLDVPLSYEGLQSVGSGLGSCGFIVYDDRTSMVELAHAVSRFLYVESCGQCPACKLGTGEITAQLASLFTQDLEPDALDVIAARLRSVTDGNRCYLPVQEQQLVSSLVREFWPEFEQAASGLRPRLRGIEVTKLLDIVDGRAVLDERQAKKNPDWTYS